MRFRFLILWNLVGNSETRFFYSFTISNPVIIYLLSSKALVYAKRKRMKRKNSCFSCIMQSLLQNQSPPHQKLILNDSSWDQDWRLFLCLIKNSWTMILPDIVLSKYYSTNLQWNKIPLALMKVLPEVDKFQSVRNKSTFIQTQSLFPPLTKADLFLFGSNTSMATVHWFSYHLSSD